MKYKTITLFTIILTMISCDMRSRKHQNREEYPPQKLFEGIQLQAAQKIFDEDNSGLEKLIHENPELLDQLSNKTGYTLLMYASIIENLSAMKELLEMGADPNIIVPYQGNDFPINHAVATNNYEMIRILLKYKASLNPAIGSSPFCKAMLLGGEKTERKMIDFLLENGADINHISYLGDNIMEQAARGDLWLAEYFLDKGGNPKIEGTEISPMAEYITYAEKRYAKHNNPNERYHAQLMKVKKILQDKHGIQFPAVKDSITEAHLRIKLYENLSEKDKKSLNFNKNYGENRYKKDQEIVSGLAK